MTQCLKLRSRFPRPALLVAFAAMLTTSTGIVRAEDEKPKTEAKSKFDTAIEGAKKQEGMWTVYHKDQQLLVDLKKADLAKEYIVLASIARGISQGMVLGGMSWGFGDDVIWTFKKVDDKIHVIRRNVRFTAKAGSPEADAVKLAYSDSVLYALKIVADSPGGHLVDMTSIFMSDDQEIGQEIGFGFRFASDRSTFAEVKSFPKNVEVQVAAVYSGSSSLSPNLLDTVVDTKGVQVHVHYSLSELPKVGSNGYKTRMADDRVGYFLTVLKDFTNKDDDQHFVRYINRWHLTKKDADIEMSPPAEPITFYIEKTVPVWLRPTVRAGILEWNKAYEKLGYSTAIQVLQQEDDADWDPEDIRYNTFRWMTADAGFAMGPSRVDPRTGQILDADIIFDAGFLDVWKQDYETLTSEDAEALRPNWSPFDAATGGRNHGHQGLCMYCNGMQHQMGFAAAVLAGQGIAKEGKLPEKFVFQGLKEVVMHEVGHTLGLRHNFKASAWKDLEAIEDPDADPNTPTVGSVMDYNPANIVPPGAKQGLYFPQTIGPYDMWAIEYGYKPITGDEAEELKKIAARGAEEGLDYATDEDTDSRDSDPFSNRFDLGKNPIAFVRRQMAHSSELLPKVIENSVEDGDGYQRARQAFGLLFSEYWRSALFAARFPGGVQVHRDHKGDADARAPFEVVDADTQRDAMDLLVESTFASPEYEADTLNHLAATRWNHWGINEPARLDYPIHETVARMQSMVVRQLFDSTTLSRILDNELKTSEDNPYTLAEHQRRIIDGAFSELKVEEGKTEFTAGDPLVTSFRRNLQREVLRQTAHLVTDGNADRRQSSSDAPEDARTLARMHLRRINGDIKTLLTNKEIKLDDYSRAHLLDMQSRIQQVLKAELEVRSID